MNVTTSNDMLTHLLELSAKVVHGLGTSFPYNDNNVIVLNKIARILGELDFVTEKMSPEEVALVKAVQRTINKIESAPHINVALYLKEDQTFFLKENLDLAQHRDALNFGALSKAVMAFVPAESKVDHLKPTIYVWSEFLNKEGRPSGYEEQEQFWKVTIFDEGRPSGEPIDAHVLRSSYYPERKTAIEAAMRLVNTEEQRHTREAYQVLDQSPPKPYLYILMRNDLQSLNAGKAVAQGTHAANQMVYEARRIVRPTMKDSSVSLADTLEIWEREANGFGTCITLSVDYTRMCEAVISAQNDGVHAGICHDPTYPLLDGKTLHLLPVDTCAYIFDWQHRAKKHTGDHPLMP